MNNYITIIGAGLAGSEAALTLSSLGHSVRLIDCKPLVMTPAHSSADFGELVCSNSLKSDLMDTASGLLKQELRMLKSNLIAIADTVRVPAGSALAVDRNKFASEITKELKSRDNIQIISEIALDWDIDSPVIIATGPLTLDALCDKIKQRLGGFLYFYDAAAPIVFADSIDGEKSFISSRYNKGTGDYINCPLNKQEYLDFYGELIKAERVKLKNFEDMKVFEGCMPVEVMAERGVDSLRFGPLRPVGLIHPVTGEKYYAVLQLRRENTAGDMYNLVGFQTNLTFSEQKRVFSLIPALKNAEYARYGVMHRNCFVDAPKTINSFFQSFNLKNTFIAGQLSGVEGYNESIASGLIAAINMDRHLREKEMLVLPKETMIGALSRYLQTPNESFQPMNANFGLLPMPQTSIRDKKMRKLCYYQTAIEKLEEYIKIHGL